MKSYSLITLILLSSVNAFACLETYQFKMFPVGTEADKIYTVDVQIRRTNMRKGQYSNARIEKDAEFDVMWVMWTHLSVYDNNQKLISRIPCDTLVSLGRHYGDTLQKYYSLALRSITNKHPELDLFTPEYISYCDFQQKCNLLSFTPTEKGGRLIYENKNYDLNVISDTSYYGFSIKNKSDNDLSGYNVSSVRIYKNKSMKLVIADIETGHELQSADGSERERKEYQPALPFDDISKAVYEEPLLHHGYGFDVFIVI